MNGKEEIKLSTGILSKEELKSVLDTLPVDITFIDKDDKVRFFNRFEDRIFKRPVSVIGRRIQDCHPKKSLAKVEQILNDFKDKKRKVAEFWINLEEKLIYIRYFPVYTDGEKYLGCLEVSQDITDIKKIEGEKRLL
ncbi:unnamed protein product [marine sediment metagenome]|uniref:PAC domain-containing protein n=1 Tax=marine sediment metagenome TaxID=412755 RepID=X1BH37_9ZZZZ